jgi:hypothetical protein
LGTPVVLARPWQKNDEWQREWKSTWRTVDAYHFYKSFGTARLNLKANGKKHITAMYFSCEIESAQREWLADVKGKGKVKSGESGKEQQDADTYELRAGVGYLLKYALPNERELADALRLLYLDQTHGAAERRAIGGLLQAFVLALHARARRVQHCMPRGSADDDDSEEGGVTDGLRAREQVHADASTSAWGPRTLLCPSPRAGSATQCSTQCCDC